MYASGYHDSVLLPIFIFKSKMEISISNRELSSLLIRSEQKNSDIILQYLTDEYNDVNVPALAHGALKKKIDRHFIPNFKKKWKDSIYSKDRFLKTNAKWLDNSFNFSWQAPAQKNQKSYADLSL